MNLKMITDATAEPVTLADMKTFMRLSTVGTAEDVLLVSLEKAARQYCENYTKRPCLPQTFQLILNSFTEGQRGDDEIILPRAPLSTAATDVVITYLDAVSANSTTLATSVYDVDINAEPGRVFLKDGQEWPDHYTQRNAVTIQFVAGCTLTTAAPATDATPEDIETWIKMRVAQMYEHREAMQAGNLAEMPHSYVDGLLDRHVLIDVRP